MLATRLLLAALLASAPLAAAQTGPSVLDDRTAWALDTCPECIHCPWHHDHCGFLEVESNGSTTSANASFVFNGTYVGVPANAAAGANGSLAFNVTRSGVGANLTQNVTIGVDALVGLSWTSILNQTIAVPVGSPTKFMFDFASASPWTAGDIHMIRYAMGNAGVWGASYAPLVVGPSVPAVVEPDPPLLPMGPLALGALVVAALLLGARRRTV